MNLCVLLDRISRLIMRSDVAEIGLLFGEILLTENERAGRDRGGGRKRAFCYVPSQSTAPVQSLSIEGVHKAGSEIGTSCCSS